MSKITNKFNAEIIIKISEFLLFSYIKITQQPLLKKKWSDYQWKKIWLYFLMKNLTSSPNAHASKNFAIHPKFSKKKIKIIFI